MNDLPQELVDKICSYLPQQHLKKVLTLTRPFRYSAERFSGFFQEYTVNERNAPEFISRFSGHRLLYLREVIFRPTLPPLLNPDSQDAESVPCRETADEARKRDEWFTHQMQWLLRTLRPIEDRPGEKRIQGRYRLSIYSPTRRPETDWICPHHVVIGWRVRLLDVELPLVLSVQSFEIYNNYNNSTGSCYVYHGMESYDPSEFKLDLRILLELATRFPSLEYLGTRTGGFEWCEYSGEGDDYPVKSYESDWSGLQRDARNGFSDAVLSLHDQLPKSIRRAHLDFLNPLHRAFSIHHSKPLPDLMSPLKHDPFSSSLRLLGHNLRHLQLRCMIDESIFLQGDNTTPIWPNLEQLKVMFHIARPDGTWYFQGVGGRGRDSVGFPVTDAHYPPYETTEDDIDMDDMYGEWGQRVESGDETQFRIVPSDKLRLLLEGFAKAAIQMKDLREAVIWCPLLCDDDSSWENYGCATRFSDPSERAWGIRYAAPGCPKTSNSSRRLEWWTLPWRPDPELRNLYQQIGRSTIGDELEELWTDDLAPNSFPYLEIFTDGFFDEDPGRIPSL